MFAIVETSGRQYQVEAGKFIDVDLQSNQPGDEVVFDKILMIVDGANSLYGKPVVTGAKVVGKVLKHGKDNKIIVYKQRPKKGTRKKQGHRQLYTRVLIDSIVMGDKVIAKGESTKKKAAEKN
jgi:large subunit ribosomal protein L21